MALSAEGYQKDQHEVSFVCSAGLHSRCGGSTVDELWKRWPCKCECHEEVGK